MNDDRLTAREAAAFLKISLSAFYKLRRRHDIPSCGIGRSLRFTREVLERPATPVPSPIDFGALGRACARKDEGCVH